ncbi:MAG TPA: ABC transporter substrate-binding protein [Acidimicrobiales bacterium]
MRTVRLTLAAILGASTLTTVTTLAAMSPVGATQAPSASSVAACKAKIPSQEHTKGTLTVATDDPVYTPWFVNNKPTNGKGYESALTYAIAKELGVTKSNVKWVVEPFDSSYVPGPKSFDFDINEISYTARRAQAVTFSVSYYDVQQSIVALKTNKIVKDHTPKELKNYLYGDQIGTTGLAYINDHIKPTTPARVYSTLDQAVLALKTGLIDAIVIDTPDGQYMASSQIHIKKKLIATQIGQFPSVGEHYGLLFTKNNPLASCVDIALNALKANGTLASLQKKWLGIYVNVPVIQP